MAVFPNLHRSRKRQWETTPDIKGEVLMVIIKFLVRY